MKQTQIYLSMLLMTSLLTLTSCQDVVGTGGELSEILMNKTLVIGTNAEYAPFEYLDGASQTVVGFDMDVVGLLETHLENTYDVDINVVVKDMAFDGLIGSLQANQIDLIAAAFTKNAERAESVLFSDIYYQAQTVVVMKSNQTKIIDYASLSGLKLGAQLGTVQVDFALEASGSAQNIKALASLSTLLSDLEVGNLDAILVEKPVAMNMVQKQSGLKYTEEIAFADDDGYAFATNHGKEAFIDEINTVIFKATEDGSLASMYVAALDASLGG